jgi:hypothetical protein
MSAAVKMDAREVKDALARRYPARSTSNGFPMAGPYVVAEELFNIDVLAFGVTSGDAGKWIGHEVKVSRSDYRSEVLNPHKRLSAVTECDRFYMATPKGLLTDEEKAFDEPDWAPEDFHRTPCPNHCRKDRGEKRRMRWLTDEEQERLGLQSFSRVECEACEQKGYVEKSRVEREAPTLWIPKDVGLIEVWSNGSRIVREPAFRMTWKPPAVDRRRIAAMLRWVSLRPDPRHDGLVAEQRRISKGYREAEREQERRSREATAAMLARYAEEDAAEEAEAEERLRAQTEALRARAGDPA